jgi:hypothetical protein
MPALPRAPSSRTGSTYSPTTSLRPIATLIWQQMAPIDGTLTPGLKVIGPFWWRYDMSRLLAPEPPYTGSAPPTPPPIGCGS